MAEPVLAVANYFIKQGAAENIPVCPMKLLKLVYIAHGWHLGLTGLPLIEEDVEAWQYGPVIPSLYRHFKGFRSDPIPLTAVASHVNFSNGDRVDPLLKSVWEAYKHYSGIELSSMTHTKDSPWFEVWHNQGGKNYYGANIHPELIRKHYAAKAANG